MLSTVSRSASRLVCRSPGHLPAAGRYGQSNPIDALFADGTDGFWYDFSKTDRTFQQAGGISLAEAPGHSIGLVLDQHSWGGNTLAQVLAGQPEYVTNGDNEVALMSAFGALTGINGTIFHSTDQAASGTKSAKYMCNTASSTSHYMTLGTVPAGLSINVTGKAYLPNGSLDRLCIVDTLPNNIIQPIVTSTKDSWVSFDFTRGPKATNWTLLIGNNNLESKDGQAFYIDNLSIKAIPGNHASQVTSGARPTRQAGGLARLDGNDDCLLSTLAPDATGMTLLAKAMVPGSNVTNVRVLGSIPGASDRARLTLNSAEVLQGAVGNQQEIDIFDPSNTSRSNAIGVMGLSWSGAQVGLYWNGVQIYDGAQSGGTNGNTYGLGVGALNNAGSMVNFMLGDIYHAIAIKKALTPAEILAASNWLMAN